MGRLVVGGVHEVTPIGDGVSVVKYRSHRGSARGGESIGDVEVAMSAGPKTSAVQALSNINSMMWMRALPGSGSGVGDE